MSVRVQATGRRADEQPYSGRLQWGAQPASRRMPTRRRIDLSWYLIHRPVQPQNNARRGQDMNEKLGQAILQGRCRCFIAVNSDSDFVSLQDFFFSDFHRGHAVREKDRRHHSISRAMEILLILGSGGGGGGGETATLLYSTESPLEVPLDQRSAGRVACRPDASDQGPLCLQRFFYVYTQRPSGVSIS